MGFGLYGLELWCVRVQGVGASGASGFRAFGHRIWDFMWGPLHAPTYLDHLPPDLTRKTLHTKEVEPSRLQERNDSPYLDFYR